MVKKTKNTIKIADKLIKLKQHLEYYYKGTPLWSQISRDIDEIKEHMFFLDENKKVEHARLATIWKKLFTKENKKLKEKVEKLEEQIEELKDETNSN